MRGFPIRTSWSHRLVINSTRLIADSHVLHRLLLPRHPPCALANFPNHHPQQVAARQAQHEHHTTNHNTTCRVKRCGHTTITIKRHTPPQKDRMRHSTQSIRRCTRPLYRYNQQHPATTSPPHRPTIPRHRQTTSRTTALRTRPLGRVSQGIICGCSQTQQCAQTIRVPASSSPPSSCPPA